MNVMRLLILVLLCAGATACASGPKLADMQASIPKVADNQGRVYFYRTALVGAAVQPSIRLNDRRVATCVPQGVSYVDVDPGSYMASVETEVERKLTFAMAAGEEKFVRCYISLGFFIGHANLELVDPKEARGEMQGLAFQR